MDLVLFFSQILVMIRWKTFNELICDAAFRNKEESKTRRLNHIVYTKGVIIM